MCRHGENIYNLSFVANRRISERRVLPSDNGKAQKPRFPTLFLGILRQKSRTFLCGMLAPQVELEPTTLRLTGVTLRFFCGRNCSFFYYICATILKTSGRRVCGRFVAENVAIFLPQAPSKRHEYMQGVLDLILHIIMQFDPSTICHIKSKGHEESKGDCAKAPCVVSREEPLPLPHPSPS